MILSIAISLVFKLFAIGCLISIEELLKFSLGAFLYVLSIIVLIDFDKLTLKKLIQYFPIFLLLNFIAFFIAQVLQPFISIILNLILKLLI